MEEYGYNADFGEFIIDIFHRLDGASRNPKNLSFVGWDWSYDIETNTTNLEMMVG